MKLHMVDVAGQYRKIKAEIDAAVMNVLDAGNFILGKEVGEFECEAAGYLGVRYAIGCASGTDALQIALMACDIGPGDEVITTPFTFVATAETIAILGATPVYVDIVPTTFNIDPAAIEQAITPRTRAIIPVHLYGQPADMNPILTIARKHGLRVIEDAAQAMGATYRAKKVGGIGDIGCISFFPSKNLGAFGDAGMIVTNDEELSRRMRMIAVHGSQVRYHHDVPGVNSRLDTLQAVILSVKLRYLEQWNSTRQRSARRYDELLEGLPVSVPVVEPWAQHIFHQYTLRAQHRDALAAWLQKKSIPHAIYYPIPLHMQKAYRADRFPAGSLPVSEAATQEVLSLPMHSELTEEQQQFIAAALREFYETR